MLGLIFGTFLLLFVAFRILLPPIYEGHKISTLTNIYKSLNELSDTSSDFSDDIVSLSSGSNMEILVTDNEFQPINSTSMDSTYMSARLFGYYTGLFNEEYKVLRTKDQYRIQTSTDKARGLRDLEMWGQLDNGGWFLVRTPVEGIEEAAKIADSLLLAVGVFVFIIAIAIIIITSEQISTPITQLTALSKRMAALDFKARYDGPSDTETGILGENFNKMSSQLEQTISDLKVANVELQKDNEKKTRTDEMRREFLGNVSHELKTPIALIMGYAEGLKDNVADDPESREFYTEVIIDEANKMDAMVKKLLTLNQLEFGQDPIRMERFNLTALIKGVVSKMQLSIKEHEATVSFPYDHEIWAWGDEFKIEEVVTNYLSNALNHLDGQRKIEIRTIEEGKLVRTSVFNTGKPIPQDDLSRIWEKFYKVDKARTREYGGHGIGLSIVKAIMDGHNQKCGVTNYSDGVAFFFDLEASQPL
ncbi:MAG: HAMP domain-containing protein [Lachnospiraceae bacterium]|nr:HAMP domain-containing protein [Candidatus Equihabitans merdae]